MPLWESLPWARAEDAAHDDGSDAEISDESEQPGLFMASEAIIDSAAQENERILIAAARAGDQDAFARLMDIHKGDVFRLAYRMVQDSDEAADISQDVFMAAWRGLTNFRGDSQLATWLYTITYHRCLRSLETQRNRVAVLSSFASSQMERLANAWSLMQANLAEQQWCQEMQDQIDRLPVKYRMVLMLRHLNDLSYEEISQILTIPLSNVKTQLFRARAMLRERLQDLESAKEVRAAAFGDRLQSMASDVEGFSRFVSSHLKPATNET